MTTQYAVANSVSGQTLTAKLFTFAAPDVVAFTADSVTERTNAKGQYVASFGEGAAISGDHTLILFNGLIPAFVGERTFAGVDLETAEAVGGGGLTAAEVNAEVVDVLNVDTWPELTTVPSSVTTMRQFMQYAFMWHRNKSTQDASERTLFANDNTTVVATEAVNDDGTTYTKSKGV